MLLRGRLAVFTLCAVMCLSLLGSQGAFAGTGVGNVPQGTQSDSAYASSFAANKVTNVVATTQSVSCYRPEVAFFANDGPVDGYSGMSDCAGAATTGEDVGNSPYPTQAGSNPGYPANNPMLVKGHSESNLQVDPTNPKHLIGSSKWFVSAEGYNHLLGFYESFDGGKTWPVQGHIPGYESWTDNTDPVGAFDGYGNYYELILPYQFFYNGDGTHNFGIGVSQEPNPTLPAEVIAASVHPAGSTLPTQWITTHNGGPDLVATYDSKGNEPDKQWITIDTNPASPYYNTIYTMWVNFNGPYGSKPFVSTAKALPDGTHTDWSTPLLLPTFNSTSADTYLLPHVDPSGLVYTPVVNFPSKSQRCCATIGVIYSTDAGKTWQGPFMVAQNVSLSPYVYPNTTFRSGIVETFAVGSVTVNGRYPLYMAWEDYSAGVANVLLSASYNGGQTWGAPIQVNDNVSPVDEFQPNLAVAPNGTVSVNFYDRRLPCPQSGTAEAAGTGLALDTVNPNYTGTLPPYGATNYCVNASIQFYSPTMQPIGRNVRLTQYTWDPQLNAAHTGCPACLVTFIGDYFGNAFNGQYSYSSFVSTYNDGTNPANRQQQVIARVPSP